MKRQIGGISDHEYLRCTLFLSLKRAIDILVAALRELLASVLFLFALFNRKSLCNKDSESGIHTHRSLLASQLENPLEFIPT